jgi:predicted nuclease of predicted toxin-antitoxin system
MKTIFFFADENIQESIIKWLKENGFNISGIRSENLYGLDDEAILQKAFLEKKVIITQDSDFGKIIFTKKVKFYSIIFLKPGHHHSDFHIPALKAILNHLDKIKEGSIIIGVRKKDDIKIRFRFLDPNS